MAPTPVCAQDIVENRVTPPSLCRHVRLEILRVVHHHFCPRREPREIVEQLVRRGRDAQFVVGEIHHARAIVVADSKAGTSELLAAVRKAGYAKTSGRRAAIREASAAALKEIQTIQPQMAYLNILREVLPSNAIVTDELSQVGFASWYGFPVYEPRTFISSGYQGTLGSGFPTALGAKVAHPDRPVVAITGDGGFMFGVQELATAVQFNIGVVTLVFNNNAYGNVRRDQRERFDGRVVASDLVNPDFVKLAESFGVAAARVTSPETFRPALEKALADGGPYVIAIEVPRDSEVSPWTFIHPAKP